MRINIIPPKYLADQHLLAEYREIKMLPKALVRSLKSKNGVNFNKLPPQYTLNKGHGFFFYDKLSFIDKRFTELLMEMKNRGFETNFNTLYDIDYDYGLIPLDSSYAKIWSPTICDYRVNIERILLRISQKDGWYKYYGKPMDYIEFEELYNKLLKGE